MKPIAQRQRGISMLGLLFLLFLILGTVTIAVKLGPHYMQYLTVRSVMQSLKENDPPLDKTDRSSVLSAVDSRLYINNVQDVEKKDFKYKKTEHGYRLSVEYQVQEHLFGNMDALLHFDHQVEVDKQ